MISNEKIWKLFEKGDQYNQSIGLYETVKRNERFYNGDQWEGLNAPSVKPVTMNFIKRVPAYMMAMLISDDIGTEIRPFLYDGQANMHCKCLKIAVDRVIEREKIKAKNRDSLRDCIVDGDSCFYFYFDADKETGQDAKGDIVCESIDNTNIMFANPFVDDVQSQEHVLIVRRRSVSAVKKEAQSLGIKDIDNIKPDSETRYSGEDKYGDGDSLVTEITMFWKEKQSDTEEIQEDGTKVTITGKTTVHFARCTKDVLLQDDTDTGYSLYPIAYWSWEKIKNSYHGASPITSAIPTQIRVNKIWTAAFIQIENSAFPKIIYNQNLFPNGWNNAVGSSIGVTGDVKDAVNARSMSAEMSPQVLPMLQQAVTQTRECMGANDTALGNIKPDNTSAIIATQKATSAPLELQRQSYFQFIEDYVRIIVDIICTDYGIRRISIKDEQSGEYVVGEFDFSSVSFGALDINVEVGASSYWSELMQIQTADNLFSKGILTDVVTYLENIPDGMIKNKQELISKFKEQQQAQAMTPNTMPNIQNTQPVI